MRLILRARRAASLMYCDEMGLSHEQTLSLCRVGRYDPDSLGRSYWPKKLKMFAPARKILLGSFALSGRAVT